jgi:hypothetical protein
MSGEGFPLSVEEEAKRLLEEAQAQAQAQAHALPEPSSRQRELQRELQEREEQGGEPEKGSAGAAALRMARGDLLLQLHLTFPERFSASQLQLLRSCFQTEQEQEQEQRQELERAQAQAQAARSQRQLSSAAAPAEAEEPSAAVRLILQTAQLNLLLLASRGSTAEQGAPPVLCDAADPVRTLLLSEVQRRWA